MNYIILAQLDEDETYCKGSILYP